ncbi:hypothetical protein QQ045_013498 [Rhodiola kirilowii]
MEATSRKCFFKIMFGDDIWKKMRIPPMFRRHFSKDIDSADTATLIGPSGHAWTARISAHEENVYLKSGWQEFLKENLVKANEMLVFTYDGNMRFIVQIFDESGLEKRNTNFPEENKKQDPATATGNKCDALEKSVEQMKQKDDAIPLLEPTRPYFSVNIKAYHINQSAYVYVQARFAKTYLSGSIVKCTLVDPDGRNWHVTIRPVGPNKQWHINTGWKDFAVANKLELSDICVFEPVEIQKQKLVLKKLQLQPLRSPLLAKEFAGDQ